MTSSCFSAPPLISYAFRGLRRCWMPEIGLYSHRFRLDGPPAHNESIPESDAFYTLNVLLGYSQLPEPLRRDGFDIAGTYARCARRLRSPSVRIYRLGMALWAGARLDLEPPGDLIDRVKEILANTKALHRATAQDIGMLISGVCAMAAQDAAPWRYMAEQLTGHLRERYYDPVGRLFYNASIGYRRRFSSFASQVYAMLALYQYGESFSQDWAIALANQAAARVIALQGPRGEWGWFYYVPRGLVVDFYEIYSVHQHGMAPAFLHHAVAHGVPGAREALVKGFFWLFGDNEMGISMLRPEERMFYRSQLRCGEEAAARRRALRGAVNAALGRADRVANHRGLVLRQECRSYELGWILWSFGARDDYPELTQHNAFAV
jgi:hypothetical protein